MKLFKNTIATSKAEKAIKYQADIVSKHFKQVEKLEDKYIYEDQNHNIVKVYQKISAKFFSKLFKLILRLEIENSKVDSNFKYKMSFEGLIKQRPKFKCVNGNSEYINILNNEKNINKILYYTKKVQIETLDIEYNEDEGKIIVEIIPYAGSIVWLIIPPITYNVQIKKEEILALTQLIVLLGKILKKQIKV